MQVDKTEVVAGQSIADIRAFFRQFDLHDFSLATLCNWMRISRSEGQALLRELKRRSWIEPAKSWNGERYYRLGIGGHALRMARFLPRISREKAERLLAGFVERAAAVNKRSELSVYVAEARVFGSYLGDAPTLGDVDLALNLVRRREGKEYVDHARARAAASGRRFSNFGQELSYADNEVKMILRARSPYLSLHEFDQLKDLGIEGEVVFTGGPDGN